MNGQQIYQSVNHSNALTSQEFTEADRVYFKNGEYYYFDKKKSEYINQGSYGQVFNCYRTDGGKQQINLCVKILTNSNKDEKQLKYQIQEFKIFIKLSENKQNLQNLMEIIDFYDDSNKYRFKIYLVMEKFDGDLSILMNQTKDIGFTEIEQIDAMQQILNGYKCLYEMNIIHRDLKPKNILYKKIEQNKIIYKISDFGFAKVIKDIDVEQELSNIGTLAYLSPQIINNSNFSYKTDIFSLGIVFYQLIFKGKHPFLNDQVKNEQYRAIIKQLEVNQFQIVYIQGQYGEQLKNLLEKMLTFYEQDRISIQEIFQLDLFKIPIKQIDQRPKIRKIIKVVQQNQVPVDIQNNCQLQQQNQVPQDLQNNDQLQQINQFLQYNLAKTQLVSLFIQHLFQENDFVNKQVRIKTFHMQMIIVCLNAIKKIYIMQAYGVIKNEIDNIPQILLQGPYFFQSYIQQYLIDQNEKSLQTRSQVNDVIQLQDEVDFQYQRTIALNFIELNKNKYATPQNLIQEISDQFNWLISKKIHQNQLSDYISWLKFFFQKLWLKNQSILEGDNTYLALTYQYLKVINLESDYPLNEFKSINLNDLTFVMTTQLMKQYIDNKINIY
ncbi:hypothetical protein pb186bvf_011936 [Paramecium bursaria]